MLALVRDIVDELPPQSGSREIAAGLADQLGKAVVETRFQRFIADGSWLDFASVPAVVFAIGQVTARASDLAVIEIKGSGEPSRTMRLVTANESVVFWPDCLNEFAKEYEASEASVTRVRGHEELHAHAVQLITDAIVTERRVHEGVRHCGPPILVVRVDSSGARIVSAEPMAR